MMRRTPGRALLVAWAIFWTAGAARAQSTDPYAATYCEPDPQTKLLYTNRAYLILPKAPDTPALYFSYQILETGKFVQRRGQFLFDERRPLEAGIQSRSAPAVLATQAGEEARARARRPHHRRAGARHLRGARPRAPGGRPCSLQELEDPPPRHRRGRQELDPVPVVRAAALHSLGLH